MLRRRSADLAGRDLLALLLQRLRHILRGQPARFELLGIEPDADRILPGAEDRHVADAGETRELVLQADSRVVREIE